MNRWTCECGKTTWVESGMPPRDCQGCDECGSTLSFNHKAMPVKKKNEHDLHIRYSEKTGKPKFYLCHTCWERIDLKDGRHQIADAHNPLKEGSTKCPSCQYDLKETGEQLTVYPPLDIKVCTGCGVAFHVRTGPMAPS